MNRKFFKELLVLIMLVLVIVFILYLLFYDVLPTNEDKIVSKEYEKDTKTEKVLSEISETTANDVNTTEDDSLIKSYSITKEDLNEYSTDNSYEKGKQDPFAESSEPVIETVKTTQVEAQKNNTEAKNEKEEEKTKTEVKNEVKNETVAPKEETKSTNTSNNTTQNTTKAETTKSTTGKFFEKKNSK